MNRRCQRIWTGYGTRLKIDLINQQARWTAGDKRERLLLFVLVGFSGIARNGTMSARFGCNTVNLQFMCLEEILVADLLQ